MPRNKSDENLAKVISSNISLEDFRLLERYAKLYYNHNKLKQPTISHLVRYLLNNWANRIRDKEEQKRMIQRIYVLIRWVETRLRQRGLDKLYY